MMASYCEEDVWRRERVSSLSRRVIEGALAVCRLMAW